jgi:hypothetical protein
VCQIPSVFFISLNSQSFGIHPVQGW